MCVEKQTLEKMALAVYGIINKTSGGGKGGKVVPSLQKQLAGASSYIKSYTLVQTASSGNATALAKAAVEAQKYDVIIVVGGDGTLSEAIHGILTAVHLTDDQTTVKSATGAPLKVPFVMYLPAGTGADFAKLGFCCYSPEDLVAQLKKLATGGKSSIDTKDVDIGYIKYHSDGAVRFFNNVASLGLGSGVVSTGDYLKTTSLKYCGGTVIFFVSSIVNLMRMRHLPLIIRRVGSAKLCGTATDADKLLLEQDETSQGSAGSVPHQFQVWKTHASTLAFCNGQYFGGGMHIAPQAKQNDGILNCTIWREKLVGFLSGTPSVYNGNACKWKTSSQFSGECFEIASSEPNTAFEVDGEVGGCLPATVGIAKTKIPMIIGSRPENSAAWWRPVAVVAILVAAVLRFYFYK